jgi:uncharacterized protein YecE (DUF72 family)
MPDPRPAVPQPGRAVAVSGRGRILAGTSGFAYPGWAPRFYPAGIPSRAYLAHYAGRLPAVELNNTFYARPTPDRIRGWVASVPAAFRFAVKAQRSSAARALAPDAEDAVSWLTESLPAFGATLGAVLFRVPDAIRRDDDRLAGLLRAWPASIPLVMELHHPSWHADETFAALRAARAVLCATDLDGLAREPEIRRTGPFLYLRLRRAEYAEAALDAWARRLVPFLDDGLDTFVIFRHDADGTTAAMAEGFAARVDRVRRAG